MNPFDDFRRIMDERSCLARDCELLGGVVIEPPKKTGFSDSSRRRNFPGRGAHASGIVIDQSYREDDDARGH